MKILSWHIMQAVIANSSEQIIFWQYLIHRWHLPKAFLKKSTLNKAMGKSYIFELGNIMVLYLIRKKYVLL